MNRKKYLACCVAASMMLGVASPAMVSASVQDDISVNEIADVEVTDDIETSDAEDSNEISFLADEDTVEASADEDTDENLSEYNNVDADLFSSGEDFTEDVGDSDVNEGWTPLTTLINENRILYKYEENEKTLYLNVRSQ